MKAKIGEIKKIVMLQSGGRDSAIACIRLLEKGNSVQAITFLHSDQESADLPRKRAEEISNKFTDYSWAAVEYTAWERDMKSAVTQAIGVELPRSCLICAIARLTACVQICKGISSTSIAVGYAGYQNTWAEQTPCAIELQNDYLEKYGFNFLIPTSGILSKSEVISELNNHNITQDSLENPCCIAAEGTQFVEDDLIKKTIKLCFDFAESKIPILTVRDSLGEKSLCL